MVNKTKRKDSRRLEKLLKERVLTKDQHKEAWAHFRDGGINAAMTYVGAQAAPERTELGDAVPYQVWGSDQIDKGTLDQMSNAARLPVSVVGALMPDAHLGYGLPIGGVLATRNAVIPYAVGVDIACRMKVTIFDANERDLNKHQELLKAVLLNQTRFGAGSTFEKGNKSDHDVLDHPDWNATQLLKQLYDKGVNQLGTSGGGNHFVEWGLFTVHGDELVGVAPGTYIALLSHSGSRGVGYKIADYYSKLAMKTRPHLPKEVKHLAWFDMDSAEGQEYWTAMHLAGEYASANHAVIHDRIAKDVGFQPLASVENHHNFAWKEDFNGEEVIVHRKGATPAGENVFGIIPGSMGDPGFVVRGKGLPESINSASHGAGRKMSRSKAKSSITRNAQKAYLKERGIELLGGGLDEAPQAYKSIHEVMQAQSDLVKIVGEFHPRIVRMADD